MKQSYNSILYKELYKQKADLSECCRFWEAQSDEPLELYQQILEKIQNFTYLHYLEKLAEKESKLLYLLMQQDGTATSLQILQKKILSESEIDDSSQSLRQKFLIYTRKCISQIKIVPYSHSIYSELIASLQNIPVLTIEDIIAPEKTNHHNQKPKSIVISDNFKKLIKVNSGQYHRGSLENSPFKNEYFNQLEKGQFKHGLLYNENLFNIALANKNNLNAISHQYQPLNKRLFFLARLYQIFYLMKTQGIFSTSKNELRKYDFDSLNQLFLEDRALLESIFEFLQKADFIQITNNQFQNKQTFIDFLKSSLNDKLNTLVNSDLKVKTIFQIISNLNKSFFSLEDIAGHYFKNRLLNQGYFSFDLFNDANYNERQIQQILDFLCQIGLIKIDSQGYTVSSICRCLQNNRAIDKMEVSRQGGVIVNNDHTLIVYPDQINDYHIFIIELFANQISDGMVLQYQFDKNTIQRGIYLGFLANDFIESLQLNSTQEIPDNIIYNIKSWAKKLKKVFVKQIMVITGEEEVLETIQLEKQFDDKIETIGSNYLLCHDKNLPDYIEADEPIYFIREGENLTDGNH